MNRTRRLVRAGSALLGLGAVVGGLPALLIGVVGWPLPRTLPTSDQVRTALDDGWRPDERFVLCVLALMVWLLWAQLMRHVFGQFRFQLQLQRDAAATGDQLLPEVAYASAPRRGMGQRLAGWLVGGLMMSSPLLPAAAMASPSRPVPVVMAVTQATAVPLANAALTPGPAASMAPRTSPSYVVHTWDERRDCLWNIAERYLGDPFRWTEIRDLNAERVQDDGRTLGENPSSWVYPGWELILPPDATGVDVIPAATPTNAAPTNAAPAASSSTSPAAPATAGGAVAAPSTVAPATTVATTAPATTTPATAPASTAAPSSAPPVTAAPLPSALPAPAPTGEAPATTVREPARRSSSTTVVTVPAPVPAVGQVNGSPTSAPGRVRATTTTVEEQGETAAPKVRRGGWSLVRDFPVKLDGAGLVGAGLLGAGVIGTLDRMRRRQRRRGRLLLPDVTLAGKELALRVGADPRGAAFVDVALRAMAGQLRESGEAVPDVLAVELGRRAMTVFLAAPAPAPPGFTARDGGRRWVLPRNADVDALEDLAQGVPAPCPALVSVGRVPDGGVLLLDLEQATLTTAVGDRDASQAVLAAAAVELATSEWADFISLVLVGFGAELAGLERVRVVDSVAEVIDELEAGAAEIASVLADAGCASTLEARVRGQAPDAWVPTIVLCHKRPPARMAKRLAAVATTSGSAGVGVLVAGAMEGAWELVAEGDGLMVGPLGVSVTAHGLAPEETAAVGDLFEVALAEEDLDQEDDSDDVGFASSVDDDETDTDKIDSDEGAWSAGGKSPTDDGALDEDTDADQPDEVVADARAARDLVAPGLPPEIADLEAVRGYSAFLGIMGPPGLWGGAKPLSRAKALELLFYLALHPRKPIDAERLMNVLWPGWQLADAPKTTKRHPTATTLNTTVTVARGCLGRGPDGRLHLPHLQGNGTRYYALEDVGLDFQIFCDLTLMARNAEAVGDPERAIGILKAAMQLVRGLPFEGVLKEDDETKPLQWVFVEGVYYAIEGAVAEAAHRLAVLCMAANDAEGAAKAAQRGLLARPGDRVLVHDLMLAGGMACNPGAVEAALRELGDLVDQDEPYDRIDAETMALYREQMARAMRRDDHGPEQPPAGSNGAASNGHHPSRPSLVNR